MASVAERLAQVEPKIQRAKMHIAEVHREVRSFLDTAPYKVTWRRDPESHRIIYYLSSVQRTPDLLPLIAGDAIHNLMSALDHLAYQIVCSDTVDKPPNPRGIYFPIADDSNKYEAKKGGNMQGARQETFDAIDRLKPYRGGTDLLWKLHRLNNIDKHRLLITVGSQFRSVNIGAFLARQLEREKGTLPTSLGDWPEVPMPDVFLRAGQGAFPLKVGDELLTDMPNEDEIEGVQFQFEVGLHEPPIVEAQSLIETLHQLLVSVEGVVTTLTPLLKNGA